MQAPDKRDLDEGPEVLNNKDVEKIHVLLYHHADGPLNNNHADKYLSEETRSIKWPPAHR